MKTEQCTAYSFHRMYAAAYTTAFHLLVDGPMKVKHVRPILGIPADEVILLVALLGERLDWKMGDIIMRPEIVESVRESLFN